MPGALALAIAGDRIAGGVGTHETALPSPDRVDLGGRCVASGLQRRARSLSDLGPRPARGAARGPARSTRRSRGCGDAVDSVPSGRLAARARLAAAATGRRRSSRRGRRWTRSPATCRSRSWRATTTRSGSTRPRSRRPTATWRSTAVSSSSTRAASRPASCARSPPGTFRDRLSARPGRRVRRRHARRAEDRRRARRDGGPRQGRLARRAAASGSASPTRARSRCGSGSRFRTTTSNGSRSSACAPGSATTCCASAT